MIPVIRPDNHADLPIEPISPDISLQWIDGGRILLSRTIVLKNDAYDRWDTRVRQWMDVWPTDRLFCILYDFRSPRYRLTLHAGTKMRQFREDYKHIPYAAAIVYTSGIVASPLIASLRLIRDNVAAYREYFTDYDKAVSWLKMRFQVTQESVNAQV